MNDNLLQISWIQETAGVTNIDELFSNSPDRFTMMSVIWRRLFDYYRIGLWC